MKAVFCIVAAALAIASLGTGCRCETSSHTGGHAPMAKAGPESWLIHGTQYRVAATYYLALPEGMQYTIEYEVPNAKQLDGMTEAAAYEMAFPLMRYAHEHDSYKRTSIEQLGKGMRQVSRIGVSLFAHAAGGTRGYRVTRSLSEIRARIASGK